MRAYELIADGFMIKLDRNIYDREAVMKALYRFCGKYLISYETDGAFIKIFFETNLNIEIEIESEVSEIMKEINFQVIRLDTARRTKGIRELLVARALYATCIEPEREPLLTSNEPEDWREDQAKIFESWAAE